MVIIVPRDAIVALLFSQTDFPYYDWLSCQFFLFYLVSSAKRKQLSTTVFTRLVFSPYSVFLAFLLALLNKLKTAVFTWCPQLIECNKYVLTFSHCCCLMEMLISYSQNTRGPTDTKKTHIVLCGSVNRVWITFYTFYCQISYQIFRSHFKDSVSCMWTMSRK